MAHTTTPNNLPVPIDDGACNHLPGLKLPSLSLITTNGSTIDISSLPSGLTIIFCYPRTGAPDEIIPDSWNAIPGARGCTPQACAFRDSMSALKASGVDTVFGLSTQSTKYQQEVKERLHLPYDILSDEHLKFVTALKLPTIEWKGKKLVRRITLAIESGKVVKVWYPVFPSDKSAEEVVEWLKSGAPLVTTTIL